MKKFLYRLILFISIMFLIGLTKVALFPNNNYSSTIVNAKLDYVEKHPEYNMYFIGSSKINEQIDPKIIDENLPGIKSYNLGANGSFNLENFQTLDKILSNKNFKPKYIIFELQDKIKITKENLKTDRSFGVFNFENLCFATKFHWENHDFKQIALSVYSFILNIFHFNKNADKDSKAEYHKFVNDYQGFMPLDLTTKLEDKMPAEKLKKDIEWRLKMYNEDAKKYVPNAALVEKINEYAQKCEQNNIKFIIFVPGPAERDAKKLEVYPKVLKSHMVNLLNPKDYPEFYLVENRWDEGHVNMQGAKILSEKTAEKLREIVK